MKRASEARGEEERNRGGDKTKRGRERERESVKKQATEEDRTRDNGQVQRSIFFESLILILKMER